MSQPPTERRHFHRIATDKPVTVHADGGEYQGTLLDISLRGLLFEIQGDWRPPNGTRLAAQIRLDDNACCILMDGEVMHVEGARIGMHLDSIDLESASRLRRMVELNLADPDLLERELGELIAR